MSEAANNADLFMLAALDRVAAHAVPIWEAAEADCRTALDLIPIPNVEVSVTRVGHDYTVRSFDLIRIAFNLELAFEAALAEIRDIAPSVTREDAIFRLRERLTHMLG